MSSEASGQMRKYSIFGIKIIGPWPLDPLVICHAKIYLYKLHSYRQRKNCLGRRSHFCITKTSQIIGAATAAPAAPLSTPLNWLSGITLDCRPRDCEFDPLTQLKLLKEEMYWYYLGKCSRLSVISMHWTRFLISGERSTILHLGQ